MSTPIHAGDIQALIDWYRAMGVAEFTADQPTDWRLLAERPELARDGASEDELREPARSREVRNCRHVRLRSGKVLRDRVGADGAALVISLLQVGITWGSGMNVITLKLPDDLNAAAASAAPP